jgi:HPr kinase/phosphorylase
VETTISGGLLRLFGVGALIIGDSGIGKERAGAHARGHQFISDDAGWRPPLTGPAATRDPRRGSSISEIFARAICREAVLDLSSLKKWERGLSDRLGLKVPDDAVILNVRVPQLTSPSARRNIATPIEVAQGPPLRTRGYHAPREMVRASTALLK